MATIIEDYCDFETAKLLKENGFDGCCTQLYNLKKQIERGTWPQTVKHDGVYMDKNGYILCPTLQMAMKWLREVHHIYLNINVRVILGQWSGYDISIHTTDNDGFLNKKIPIVLKDNMSYEQACEEAIKYCLKHLI